ncbi:MAG: devS [Mycobacterium sp.]|nr:devS [Mycobacterium sp.]
MTRWGIAFFAVAQVMLIGLAAWAGSAWLLALGEVALLPVSGCVALAGRYLALRARYLRDREGNRRDAERRRIADDVHDLVGHELSLIAMQAGLLELRSEPPEAALAADVRVRAEAAVHTLHDSLDLINDTSTQSQVIADIPQLVEQSRNAGALVTLTGTLGIATAPIRVTAMSVVRESLTNAARHAPGKRLAITLCDRGDTLEIVVETATGSTAHAPPEGRGLSSIRRRLESLGGTLQVSQDAHRHLVVARLPRSVEHPAQVRQESPRPRPARTVLRQAAVPTFVSVAAVLAFYTWASTGSTIAPDAQAKVKAGMSASSAADLLPDHQARVRLAHAPTHPNGWQCRVFTNGNFPLAVATFEVCFSEGAVVRVTDLARTPLW